MRDHQFFRFDVLAQLANIPNRITLYELLRLSKSTREALREAHANFEIFLAQIPAMPEEEAMSIIIRPPDISHASHSLQRICKSKENMIDPCITQGTL